MASACVNSATLPTYTYFNPRASRSTVPEEQEDFEFSLVEQVEMLPADELFSEGKLVTTKQQPTKVEIDTSCNKAPRCSRKWRELLGLKRFSQNPKPNSNTNTNPRTSSSSLKQFLNRSSRSCSTNDTSLLNLPLLKDSDTESVSVSSSTRMSLSSSSSSGTHDHEELLPRLSLDSHVHTATANPFAPSRSQNVNAPRMRLVNRSGRSPIRELVSRGVSVDSPRLNSSGKIVFQSLERSSSSPSSFNGGTSGYRHRGMERSYSSNVRVTPVLNVPVCSIRGGSVVFGQFFSSGNGSSNNIRGGGIIRGRISTYRN